VQPRTTPHGPFPVQYAFVVQFAAETTLDATDVTGRVEHGVSGHATRFTALAALYAFMVQCLQDVLPTFTAADAEKQPPGE
jgi:hypothetical protein